MKNEPIIKKVYIHPRHLKKLHTLRKVEKKKFHPLQHHIHKKHNLSRKTIFYMKEYGPHTNVSGTIIKESIKILLLASLISSFGGLALENVKDTILAFAPLLIMLPVLNGMTGNYGIVISSKFSTLLHEGKVNGHRLLSKSLLKLLCQTLLIAAIMTLISTAASIAIAGFSYAGLWISIKIFFIAIMDVFLLVSILFLVSIFAGIYFYKKGEDPSNFLIPITTSIADFGNMILLSVLVLLLL